MITRLKKNGHILLPAKVIEEINLKPGDVFYIRVIDGEVILSTTPQYPPAFYHFLEDIVQELVEEKKKDNVQINSPEEMMNLMIQKLQERKKQKEDMEKN